MVLMSVATAGHSDRILVLNTGGTINAFDTPEELLKDTDGYFAKQYAEENHFLFPSLRIIVDSIGEDTLFEGLDLGSDDWEEMEEYEYAFV